MTKAPREGDTGGAPALANARKSHDTSGHASQSGGHPSPPASVLSQSHQSSSKLANLLTQAAASQTKELVKAQKFKDAALGSAGGKGVFRRRRPASSRQSCTKRRRSRRRRSRAGRRRCVSIYTQIYADTCSSALYNVHTTTYKNNENGSGIWDLGSRIGGIRVS